VLAVLDSGHLAAGPVTGRLERDFARKVSGTREAVAVANGTAALHLALLAHDVGPGDEVITTAFSFQATANMILVTGAKPVFVDVCDDGNIDASQVEAAITPRTKAMLPVHLYGRLCAIEALEEIAVARNLVLIEDAAQAHGAMACSRPAGSFGTGCFSLYATKNMTAGEGGMITTDDAALAERLRRLRSHGESRRYVSVEAGYNYRMSDITSAVALAQLQKLEAFTEKRRENAAYLSSHLEGVTLPPEPLSPAEHVWHQYTVRVPEGRDRLVEWLREREIESSVFYPYPLPSQPLYLERGLGGDFPVATRLAGEVLSLPLHPGLSRDDLDRVIDAVNTWQP
jgi:dTDP-4-amino-4,6-dideoxygalactose transaminase